MSDTLFATLIERIKSQGKKSLSHFPDDWLKGPTVYGGLITPFSVILIPCGQHAFFD